MIKFSAKLKPLSIEQKSIKKRDGGMFNFTEVRLEHGTKYKTLLVARATDEVAPSIKIGKIQDMDIGISSNEGSDGRVFNNFVITDILPDEEVPTTESEPAARVVGDDLPF